MNNKRGQGVSINVIIVAAIALVVLIVLIAIFTGRIGVFTQQVGETADKPVGQQFGADCHPAAALISEYNQQKADLDSEVASLEAAGESTGDADSRRSELVQNFGRVESACGAVTTRDRCTNTPVNRGSLSGSCDWQ